MCSYTFIEAAKVRQTSTQNARADEELASSLQKLKSELASLEKELVSKYSPVSWDVQWNSGNKTNQQHMISILI